MTKAFPISKQVERLDAVVKYLEKRHGVTEFTFIGHSQGCLVVALLKPKNSKIFLLAPPMVEPFKRFIKTPGWSRPGSHLDLDGESVLKRSDGSITEVSAEFWHDFKKIDDPERLYEDLMINNNLKIFIAGAENVLINEPLPNKIPYEIIEKADHDFKAPARAILLQKLKI